MLPEPSAKRTRTDRDVRKAFNLRVRELTGLLGAGALNQLRSLAALQTDVMAERVTVKDGHAALDRIEQAFSSGDWQGEVGNKPEPVPPSIVRCTASARPRGRPRAVLLPDKNMARGAESASKPDDIETFFFSDPPFDSELSAAGNDIDALDDIFLDPLYGCAMDVFDF
jgi:hypothetical protein